MAKWRVRRGENGWLTFHWVVGNGDEIVAYPIPLQGWEWAYPYDVFKAIRAIQRTRDVYLEKHYA